MRNSNFELLRIICILLILIMHISSMTDSLEFNHMNSIGIRFISSIGNIGVSCFILISGYFGAKFKINKFIHLVYITTFYCIISYILNSTTPIVHFNIVDFFKSFFNVLLYKNWFITCYLILMLLAPFIEDYLQRVEKKSIEKLLLILFLILSFLPTLFNTPYYTVLTMGGKSLTYFVFVYLVGRYIKMYQDVLFKRATLIFVFIGSTIVINLFNNIASYFLNKSVSIYSMDCSPLILVSSVSIFYLFKSLNFKSMSNFQ